MLDAPALPTLDIAPEGGQNNATSDEAFGRRVITVPAVLSMAGMLREAVDRFLPDHPRRIDARQVVDEFASTALIEQRCTCCPHGQISLAVDWDEQRIRLEVSYYLVLSHAPRWKTDSYEDPVDTYGRGLALINAFCDRWGHFTRQLGPYHYSDTFQTWYAELDDVPPQPSTPGD